MKKNFFYNFLLTGSNLLFPLLTFPYLSRILGVEGLGVTNFIISYGQNYMIIAALGLPVYGIREISKLGNERIKRSVLFFELLLIHFIVSIFFLIVYIFSIFFSSEFKDYYTISLLGGVLIILNVFTIQWLFTGVNDFKYITIRSLLVKVISLFAIYLFVQKKDDYLIFFIILILSTLLNALIDVYYARKLISFKINFSFKGIFKHFKPISILGIYMVLTSIYSVLPATLLGFLSTKSAVGYYYTANRIVRIVISLFAALISVFIPQFNYVLENRGIEAYNLLIVKSINIIISFAIPISFFVYLSSSAIVKLLTGDLYYKSILLVQIMSPVILLVPFAQIFVLLILNVFRKDFLMVILSVIGMSISLLINLLFIPVLSENATAYSQLFAELFVTILSFFFAKNVHYFYFPIRLFFLNIIFAIPFAVITYLFSISFTNNFLILLMSSLFCGLYFIIYQLYVLKNSIIIDMITFCRVKIYFYLP